MEQSEVLGSGGFYSFVSQFVFLNLPKQVVERMRGTEDFDDEDDAKLYSRLSHEISHFFQNVGTTYGMWKTLTLRKAGAFALQSMLAYRKSGRPIRQPFEDCIPRGILFPMDPDNPFTCGALSKQFLNWVRSIDGPNACPTENPEQNLFGVLLPRGDTHVHVAADSGIRYIMAAKELIEFQARAAQVNCLNSTRGITPSQRDALITQFEGDVQSRLPIFLSNGAFGERTYDSLLACLSIADIALNGEWPLFWVRLLKQWAWEDVHPGWRFERICRLIRERKIRVPNGPEELLAFQRMVCSEFEWPIPAVALQQMVEAFEALGLDLLGYDDLVAGARRALHCVRSAPGVLLPFWFGEQRFRDELRPYCRGPLFDENRAVKVDACLQDLALQLTFGRGYICPRCLNWMDDQECDLGRFRLKLLQ